MKNYWFAMEGTLDPAKVEKAVDNAIVGNPQQVAKAIKEKYHPGDRLMLWFDFNNHDNAAIQDSMESFMRDVAPLLNS
jgi:alkanesulfonate monooxygenase SsuD/methylene tetrahydromethanopterin reductase-like flavin-dependent oxidoreductase (luciferase family)